MVVQAKKCDRRKKNEVRVLILIRTIIKFEIDKKILF